MFLVDSSLLCHIYCQRLANGLGILHICHFFYTIWKIEGDSHLAELSEVGKRSVHPELGRRVRVGENLKMVIIIIIIIIVIIIIIISVLVVVIILTILYTCFLRAPGLLALHQTLALESQKS